MVVKFIMEYISAGIGAIAGITLTYLIQNKFNLSTNYDIIIFVVFISSLILLSGYVLFGLKSNLEERKKSLNLWSKAIIFTLIILIITSVLSIIFLLFWYWVFDGYKYKVSISYILSMISIISILLLSNIFGKIADYLKKY